MKMINLQLFGSRGASSGRGASNNANGTGQADFTIPWSTAAGSETRNSLMIDYFERNDINYARDRYGSLIAEVDNDGNFYRLDGRGDDVYVDRSEAFHPEFTANRRRRRR